MRIRFWVKFKDNPPEMWTRNSFEEFWHDLADHMNLHGELELEWMIGA